jgi:hypothetical protein
MASLDNKPERVRDQNPLLAGLIGGGIAVLISKAFDLIAAGYAGRGYQLEFPGDVLTALFIVILMVVLLISRPRRSEVQALAEENDRRLAELDTRLNRLLREAKR